MKEYRQGDIVSFAVRARDDNGVKSADAWAGLEGGDGEDPYQSITLRGWTEVADEGYPAEAEIVLSGDVEQQRAGVYEIRVMVMGNAYEALTRHEIDPPLRFRVVEHPDDVREGPEVLSVGELF